MLQSWYLCLSLNFRLTSQLAMTGTSTTNTVGVGGCSGRSELHPLTDQTHVSSQASGPECPICLQTVRGIRTEKKIVAICICANCLTPNAPAWILLTSYISITCHLEAIVLLLLMHIANAGAPKGVNICSDIVVRVCASDSFPKEPAIRR